MGVVYVPEISQQGPTAGAGADWRNTAVVGILVNKIMDLNRTRQQSKI